MKIGIRETAGVQQFCEQPDMSESTSSVLQALFDGIKPGVPLTRIEKSFDMFLSFLGVWVPQALIFAATYSTGKFMAPEPGSILSGP